jgi:ribonuclease G
MQSAFVDLGLERDTFLYVSDFFEENEDIDTVEEKPARGERRDRGQIRPVERTTTDGPVLATSVPAEGAQQEAPAPAPGAGESVPGGEAVSGQPGAGDRGMRGDRRGRRSRRRRQRGRGFPENKYAQPGGAPAPSTENREEEPGEDEAAELIVLPGESLAKYRHAPATEEVRPLEAAEPESEADLTAEHDDAGVRESPSGPLEHELETEAEEIELTDKIFGHRDETETVSEEEKIEEVKDDRPSEATDFSSTENAGQNVIPIRTEGVAEEEFSEPATGNEAGLDGDAAEAEEAELEAAEEGIPDVDDTILDNVLPIADPAIVEDSEPQPSSQSATVREQGGRYLHRVSRRMRRRRGGNRFEQQRAAEPGSESAGNGAGAAAAMESELRRSESPRESAEDHSTASAERALPSISDLLKPGQEIIVQIAKEPLGQKGARITSHIALPGRYVVFMPSVSHLGVSRKVSSEEERQRLKRILQTHRVGTTGGFIVRTAGEGVPEEEIAADMNFLYSLWLDIRQKAEKRPAPALLHHDLDIVQRILRDQVTDEFKAIWVDNEELYENVLTFMQRFQPALVNRVKMYTRQAPIFDAFNITQELEKALRPKVWLKSGGYIVINQTEALVAIDVNTGKYVGKSNRLEDTIVKTNIEAVKEIVRQIRLRDLGGIIVVDFIDMDERKNRQKVMQALEEAMRADKAPYKILQFNDFGLVAITRKRVKQSLERTLCAPCPYCEAAGYVKSVQTIISEILVEAQKIAKAIEGKDVMLRVHPDVAKVLKASDNQYLEELEEILHRPVLVTGDPTLHHEKFDLV